MCNLSEKKMDFFSCMFIKVEERLEAYKELKKKLLG